MKNTKLFFRLFRLIIVILFGTTFFVLGQSPEKKIDVGLGVIFFDLKNNTIFGGYNYYSGSVYIPVTFPDGIRFEPEIGLFVSDGDNLIDLGFGVIKTLPRENITYNFGIRFGLITEPLYSLSPLIGAEYFLSNKFSLGAEIQYINFFDDMRNYAGYLNTQAVIRFYF